MQELIKKKYKTIKKKITIVRYNNNDEYTKKISLICNARLIWGGDNTISNIRKISLNQKALDLSFISLIVSLHPLVCENKIILGYHGVLSFG